jgi:uncharacterized protein (TIGR02145 family)
MKPFYRSPFHLLPFLLLVVACKEEKEEPIYFETTAPAAYTFPDTEASATFTVSGNTAWAIDVTEGRDRCSVTPASGQGDATVTVRVAANPSYVQHSMSLVLTAGDYTKQVAITQAAPPCPGFNPGAIATAGQTVTIGGPPAAINSTQAASGGDGNITYQWYKNGNAINGATGAVYTPPLEDAATVSTITYTRRAKDNDCNPTFTPSAGSWVLTVTCPSFSAGSIATAGQMVTIGGTPATINSTQAATGNGAISYQWYKNGNTISGATAASYTPPKSDAATAGVITYTRRAKDNVCNTTFTPSAGSWVLTVTCPSFSTGTIATTGQTIFVGGTPVTIESIANATSENGSVSYQWYRNESVISGATSAYYTPPQSAATAAGVHTYTRRAKDNVCNTTLTPSAGSWVLSVTCPSFNPGAIATTGQSIFIGGTPATILSTTDATSDNGMVSYQWYKNGNTISGATATSYTPPKEDATAAGVHTYTRRAKDNVCNTTFTPSTGSWVLTITAGCHSAGATATFNNFFPCAAASYGATWQLTDDRDGKTYNVRYLPDGRYWMVQDLRYGGSAWDACVNRTTFNGTSSSNPTHRFGTNTYGDCTNARNSDTPAERGYLYDWAAAMQAAAAAYGYSYYGCSGITESANACQGICPPGFHVPTREEYVHADAMFIGYYSCSDDACWRSVGGWAGVLGGYTSSAGSLSSQGSTAFYWSSKYDDSWNAYGLSFNSGTVFPGTYAGYKYYGRAVRCVRNY